MGKILTLQLDERTTVEKEGGTVLIRQLDYFKENEKTVILTTNDIEEIIKLSE